MTFGKSTRKKVTADLKKFQELIKKMLTEAIIYFLEVEWRNSGNL